MYETMQTIPNHAPSGATVVYARYSSDDQNPTSIDDQAERCWSYAKTLDGRRPDQLVKDEGESVKDRTAPNWNRLLDDVRAGRVKRVYVDEISRVTRDLEKLLHVRSIFRHYGASLIAVLERIDLADEQADLPVIFSGYKNQAATRDARHRIKRSMDGNLRRLLSNGDTSYGYSSRKATEKEILALGLPPRPKDKAPYRVLIVNDAEAANVRKIHHWFAVQKMSIRAIARKLNLLAVPRGGKARTQHWKPIHVRKILTSRRYLGYRWRNETTVVRNPDTGRREVKKQEPSERIEVHDARLTIIDQATYDATHQRFAEIHEVHPTGKRGWKRRSGSSRDYAPKHLFSGTLVCAECGAKLSQMAGHLGGYYGCPNAPLGVCSNKVKANRCVTEKLLLEAIRRELNEHVIVGLVHALLDQEIDRTTSAVPAELTSVKKRLATLEGELDRLVQAIAHGGDLKSLTVALRQREEQKAVLERQIREMGDRAGAPTVKPSRNWVARQLTAGFGELLAEQASRAALILREITGEIRVSPDRKPWLRKPHLVARVTIDFAAACGAVGSDPQQGVSLPPLSGFGTEIEVPLRETPFYERYGWEVVRLHDEHGKSFAEIARELPGAVNTATVRIAYNFGKYGTPDPGDRAWRNHCRRRGARRAAGS